jgi:hypothetical protein
LSEISAIVYDTEIKRCIPSRGAALQMDLEYCTDWDDFAGMGVACVCAWDCKENVPLIFTEENLSQLKELILYRKYWVGFNNARFDNKLLEVHGVEIPKYQTYDILRELWIADNLNPDIFDPKTHGGYSLENCAQKNFGIGKSGNGAQAPEWWQRGQRSKVLNYCLRDVMITRRLFMRVMSEGAIVHPKDGSRTVKLRRPGV